MLSVKQDDAHVQIERGHAVLTEETTHLIPRGLSVTVEGEDDFVVIGWVIGFTRDDPDGARIRVLRESDRLEVQVPLPARVLANAA